uniref:Uncharacterized protein n=1 Tax=Kalanchoe fedtschenkoi TaxID=63787 RepID=A0A7N0TF76_KALFE
MASSTTTAAAADSPPSEASGSFTPGTLIVAASADAQVVEDASDNVPVRSDEAAPDGSFSSCKKPVWNKPSNEAIEVEPVMGADSWPALSEIAKGPQKSSAESNKSAPEASSLPFLQVSCFLFLFLVLCFDSFFNTSLI